ncbi:MAG: flagellar M-ring protein FliF [Bryobacteraceae bacterium]|nr:flagellar M-ring protein FliF [Bryobacteraceae bacterium]
MNLLNQIRGLFARLTWRQRISLAVAVLAVGGGLAAVTSWNKERDFKPLYKGLAAEDAGQVTARLREKNVEFRLEEGGATVLVPSNHVDEMRLDLASAGLPKTGRIGYELFDKMNFGATDFAEQVNYHRAIEGELERSTLTIAEVEQARVHVTFAKHSVFEELREAAKASVMVKLKAGRKLSPASVIAIQHLAASAVEGLEPPKVAVLDMGGKLLSKAAPVAGADDAEHAELLLAYRRRVENELLQKVNSTLEPLLGPDKFRASVSVDVDLTSGEQSEETFDPNKSVMVTQQRGEDSSSPQQQAGVPGTASNLPRPTGRAGSSANAVSRRTENITFQSSRVVRKTKTPQGVTRRLSLAVLVDQAVRWEGAGPQAKRILDPVPPAQLKSIRDLVMGAVGASAERGDQVIVETLAFDATLRTPPPALPVKAAPVAVAPNALDLRFLPKPLQDPKILALAGCGALLMLLGLVAGVVIFLRKRGRAKQSAALVKTGAKGPPGRMRGKGKSGAEPAENDEALDEPPASGPAGEGPPGPQTAVSEGSTGKARLPAAGEGGPQTVEDFIAEGATERARQQAAELAKMKISSMSSHKNEILAKHIADEALKNPSVAAQVVRSWMQEG